LTSEHLAAPGVSAAAFWEDLYARQSDRWELGGPTPPLIEYLHRRTPPPGRVAVPGCGRGHDARLLARRGYRVWGFDFATPAIDEARAATARAGLDVVFEQRDVFGLTADYAGFFDGLWEYTSFCAIDPARRAEYVEMVRGLVKPGGWLLACFFPVREGSGGPPFPATQDEIRRLWTPAFDFVEAYVPETSAPGRQGVEWMVRGRVRPG
jgi:SAM-dependent methyltransferase